MIVLQLLLVLQTLFKVRGKHLREAMATCKQMTYPLIQIARPKRGGPPHKSTSWQKKLKYKLDIKATHKGPPPSRWQKIDRSIVQLAVVRVLAGGRRRSRLGHRILGRFGNGMLPLRQCSAVLWTRWHALVKDRSESESAHGPKTHYIY